MKMLRIIKNEDFGFANVDETKLTQREAVRAVLLNKENEVAIIPVRNGTYHKIPGGGIEQGEDHKMALVREVKEEAGAKIEIIGEIGKILEYREDNKQYSYCYLAKVVGKIHKLKHTQEEIKDGFQKPVWLPIDKAIETFKNDKATFLRAKFMSLRDRTFLEEVQTSIDKLARKIWNYHHMHQRLRKADCILVFGSQDTRTAEWASELFLKGYAPVMVFSGGYGKITKKLFNRPEAEMFSAIAIKRGVPRDKILIENKSTNTSENIEFSKSLLEKKNLNVKSFILVDKPYKERRDFATVRKLYPGMDFIVTSPKILFKDCATKYLSKDACIGLMMGDLKRIVEYPKKGFQVYQAVPKDVRSAYDRLIELGYDKYLV